MRTLNGGSWNRCDNIGFAQSVKQAREMLRDRTINIIALLFARPRNIHSIRSMFTDGGVGPSGDYVSDESALWMEIENLLGHWRIGIGKQHRRRTLLDFIVMLHHVQQQLFGGDYFSGCFHSEEDIVRFPYSHIPHTDVRYLLKEESYDYWRMVTVLTGDHLLLYPNCGADREMLRCFRDHARPLVNPSTLPMTYAQFQSLVSKLPHYQEVCNFPRFQLEVGTPVLIRHEPEHLSVNGGIHSGPAFEKREPVRRVLLHTNVGPAALLESQRLSIV